MAWNDNHPGDDGFYRGDAPVNGPDFGQHDGTQQMWPGSDLYGAGQRGGRVQSGQPDSGAPTQATFSAGPEAPTSQLHPHPPSQYQSYGQQAPPPRRRLAAVVGAIVVVLALIGGVTYFFLGRADQGESDATTATSPATSVDAVVPGVGSPAPEVQRAEGVPEPGSVPTALTIESAAPSLGEQASAEQASGGQASGDQATPVGESSSVEYGDATLNVAVLGASWQPGSAWGEPWEPTEAGFLVINLDLERTDAGTSSASIPWWSWTFQSAEGGAPVEADLIGGGYEPTLSSPSLAAGEKLSGVISFVVKSTAGTLTMSDSSGAVGQWQVTATPADAPVAVFGTPATSSVGGFPLEVTVQQAIWDANPDAVVGIVPENGHWLYADYTAALAATAPPETDSFQASVRYDSWHFFPDGGGDYAGELGEIYGEQTSMTYVEPGVPGAGRFRIDAPAQAGTLALVGDDGTVIMKWAIAAP